MSINNIELEVRWILFKLNQPERNWEFQTTYWPKIGIDSIEGPLSGSQIKSIADINLLGLQSFVSEIIELAPPNPIIELGGVQLKVEGSVERILHYPFGDKENKYYPPNTVTWVKNPLKLAGNEYHEEKHVQNNISFDLLSSSAKYLIQNMDSYAVDDSYKMFYDKINSSHTDSSFKAFQLRKAKVFISYRNTNTPLAVSLFNSLRTYGQGKWFEPYLDLHKMRIGDWRQQLAEQIKLSDIFIPIVSSDFSELGSISEFEHNEALDVSIKRHLSDFIAPVIPRGANGPVVSELKDKYHSLIMDDSEFNSEKSKRFFKVVHTAAISHDPI